MAIYIFTDEIQSGKTTRLMKWVKNRKVGGILSPDQNGLRMLYDISTGKIFSFQLPGSQPNAQNIGRFYFKRETFDLARRLLLQAANQSLDWIVVDEVGPLELQGLGFEPAVSQLIELQKDESTQWNLLLVVRESLVQAVQQKYNIKDAKFLDISKK